MLRFSHFATLLVACAAATVVRADSQSPVVSGDAVIRAAAGGSEIVISTTSRVAGAVHSLTWGGREFIDSTDHGRQMQSASNLDVNGKILGETFNPTEAGSRRDGAGQSTTSRLVKLHADGASLETTTQMAFWLRPGESSGGNAALNASPLSNHLLTKRIHIGQAGLSNVIEYEVAFTLPKDEKHKRAVFEALTGYMPAAFEKFWTFNPATSQLAPISDDPGEQTLPLVFSTADSEHAMGIYSAQKPRDHERGPSYGRWRFHAEKVVKWNCVFRVSNDSGIAPGDYKYRMSVAVGTLDNVRTALTTLIAESNSAGTD